MTERRWDALLEKDWGDDWDSLPPAPEFPNRPKSAQITLRLPGVVLDRVKKVASARSLPYHALARSWIADGVREPGASLSGTSVDPQNEQLNIKLDEGLLDALKKRAHELGQPYHRLAREWIQAALEREEASLGIDPTANPGPGMMDVMLLLLHSPNARGEDAVRGITQMQKLLFVIEQKVGPKLGFYAFNYGPYNENVNDAADALRLAGFMRGGASATARPPTFAEMMAVVVERAGPSGEVTPAVFALSREGHERAERLRKSNRAYQQLYEYVSALRVEWDTPDLLNRVYEEFPKYTEHSLIKETVGRRKARRR